MLSLETIEEASRFLKSKIIHTPIEHSPVLSQLLKVPVYLKLEFLQRTGSFKLRGGLYAISQLTEEQKKKGVATCSAGNHGLALAYAASAFQIPCTVFVPSTVDAAKLEKLKNSGARIERSPFSGYDETMKWSLENIQKRDLHFISPFDGEEVMTANGGTLALEIIEEIPDAAHFILPFGGGGLAAGFSFYAKNRNPHCKIIACQHEGSPALKLSLQKGQPLPNCPLLTPLQDPLKEGSESTALPTSRTGSTMWLWSLKRRSSQPSVGCSPITST